MTNILFCHPIFSSYFVLSCEKKVIIMSLLSIKPYRFYQKKGCYAYACVCTHESKHFLERSLFAFCGVYDCMLFCQHFLVALYACMRMCVCVRVGVCMRVCVCVGCGGGVCGIV